ncbi:MAG: hypothetical protein HQM09_24260 [Candidatus Riflebacteria bacterium]|nr:hypothetical protein [Candidatus Riflebacteria bacterium]
MNSFKLIQIANGSSSISGMNFTNIGSVIVNGTLAVNGSVAFGGNVTVNSGGILKNINGNNGNISITGNLINNGTVQNEDPYRLYISTTGMITNTGIFSPRTFGANIRYLSIWDSRNPPNGWSDKFTNGSNGLCSMNFVPRFDGLLSSGFRLDYTLTNTPKVQSVSGSKDISGVNWATEGRYSGEGYANVYFQFTYPSATGTYRMNATLIDSYGPLSTISSENTITFP